MPELILDPAGALRRTIDRAVRGRRILVFAGLPGTGKSLLLQQAVLLAGRAGRGVHLLQWDVTRAAFETEANLRRYPQVGGVTHIAVRRAVGRWVRQGIADWRAAAPPSGLLIGEAPLLGNRLIELAAPAPDAVEPLLRGEQTLFLIPVPSREVRRVIEAARARTARKPRHEREKEDAPPDVLRSLYREVELEAERMGIAAAAGEGYDPDTYSRVFRRLLKDRNCEAQAVDEVLPVMGSVYDLDAVEGELAADPEAVARFLPD